MCFKCSPCPLATSTSCEIASFHETRMPIRSRWFFAIFLGNHKNYPNVKTLHLAILFGIVFLFSIPSTHHHWPITIYPSSPRHCPDVSTPTPSTEKLHLAMPSSSIGGPIRTGAPVLVPFEAPLKGLAQMPHFLGCLENLMWTYCLVQSRWQWHSSWVVL